MEDPTFGQLLRDLLTKYGYSNIQLADKLKINRANVSKWINDGVIPGVDTVLRIATILKLEESETKALLKSVRVKGRLPIPLNEILGDDEISTSDLPANSPPNTTTYTPQINDQFLLITDMFSELKKDIKRGLRTKGQADADASPNLNEALAKLESLPIDTIPPVGNLPVGSRVPHSVSKLFVGRETELNILASALKGGETIAIGQIAATTGLGGIGKTQLAVEFVHRYGQFFAGGVHWLSFADPNGIATEMAACGLIMPELRADFDTFKLEEQVQLVLAAWESPLPRLLIFDNCEDPTLLEQWRPKTGGSRVLITSRRQQWDTLFNIQPLILGILTQSQSIELLRKFRPDLAESDPMLEEIANELGHLPLALHLAGNYLKTYRYEVTPEEYLAQIRHPALLQHSSLQQGDLSPTGHEQHVARTFAISYDRLQLTDKVDSLALDLLARGAWFAPGQLVPRSLLLACVELSSDENKLQLTDAVQRLADLGLVAVNADGHVLIHRLIARFIQNADLEKSHTAHHSVASTLLKEANQINNSLLGKPLLTWQNHLRFVTDTINDQNDDTTADLYNALGTHLYLVGAYAESAIYSERSLAICKLIYGENHSVTAASHCHLGALFHSAGNLQAAKSHLELSLSIRQAVCGEKHPYTAESYGNLASLFQTMGKLADAKLYYERAIDIYEVTFGKEHHNTVSMYSGLADLLQIIGDYVGAKHYLEQTLIIYEEKWGKEHPETGRIYNSLGMLLKRTGNFIEARSHLTKAVQIAEKELGTDHPKTADIYNSLGQLLMTTGDYKEAKSYLIQSLKIKESALGIDHLNLITGYSNLGMALLSEGDMSEAKHYLEQAFALAETVLDNEHITMASIYNNLGHLYSHLFNLEKAKSYYELSLHIKEKTLGKDHPDIADSYNNLYSDPNCQDHKVTKISEDCSSKKTAY